MNESEDNEHGSSTAFPECVAFGNVTSCDVTSGYYVTSGKDPNAILYDRAAVIVKCVIMILLSCTGIFGNTLTLVAIKKTPRLWTKSNTLISHVAVIDLILLGPSFIYYVSYQLLVYVFSNDPCHYHTLLAIFYPIDRVAMYANSPTIIGIAVDRYVAIVYPLHYDVMVTERRIRYVIAASWIYGVSVCSIYGFWLLRMDWSSCDDPQPQALTFGIDLTEQTILSTTMTVLYARILMVALKHQRKIGNPPIVQEPFNPWQMSSQDQKDEAAKLASNKRWRQELKAARMTAVLIGAYIFFGLPYFVARGLVATGNTGYSFDSVLEVTSGIAGLIISLDWVLYAIFSKEFREAYKRLLKCSSNSGNRN